MTKSRNELTIDGVRQILESEYSNPLNATGFRNRLLFAVGSAIGARPTELWLLNQYQFKEEIVEGRKAVLYYPELGSALGDSKNSISGIAVGRNAYFTIVKTVSCP